MLQDMDAVFGALPLLSKDWEAVYDRGVFTGASWPVYGSRKPHGLPYMCTQRYTYSTEDGKVVGVTELDGSFFSPDSIALMSSRTCKPAGNLTEYGKQRAAARKSVSSKTQPILSAADHPEQVRELVEHLENIPNEREDWNQWFTMAQTVQHARCRGLRCVPAMER